ncbi:Uncharacterised protein [Dorea longicatena]|uniref:Uncharacterized protein n=1 Tax=Dorea longicatena TaxID=88431 RepID=A0A173U1W2_9FIRM|nr:DUF6339 family protein [Dorea longicatena]CUN08115.1 Uncharacterised protein [Dorea longicatena]
MKLYFMKKEALDILKSNLDMVYNMYFTEKDNKWLWKVCGGDPFGEFKEIQDFQLAPIDSDMSKGEVEFANCKIIYQHLSFLTESQACDERLWAGLCHSVYYDYLRKRWDYDTKSPKTQKEAVSNIKSRFFFSGGTRAGLFRNSIAKCWWVGRNTYDPSNVANPVILNGIVKAFKNFKEENTQLSLKEHIRPTLQFLNAVGGGVVLDCLDEDEIADMLIDNIYGILQGDEQGVEIEEESEEYEDMDVDGNDISEEENSEDSVEEEYIVIGQKVNVRIKETDEPKTILVNYLPNSTKIPPLAKSLLGCWIGDEVSFQGKTYIIEAIQK